jgi:DNA repair protein RecN (Recombination protein N)
LNKLQDQQRNATERLDMLQFQIKEIEEARLIPGEEEDLRSERIRLANAETLSKLAAEALTALDEAAPEGSSATDLLGISSHHLVELSHIDSALSPLSEQLETALTALSDTAYELRVYLESLEFNPKRLDQIEERLDLFGNLKRKYGGSTEAVISHLANIKVELDEVTNSTEQISQVGLDMDKLLVEMGSLSHTLSRTTR